MRETAVRRLREDEYREPRQPGHVGTGRPAAARPAPHASRSTSGENGRRTITITGHPVPPRRPSTEGMHLASDRAAAPRRRPSPAQAQIQARPDRVALWAFLLGLFLVFMAVATANAATV